MPDTPPRPYAAAATEEVDLVLLGGDIGIYALARAFHERFGITSTVVTRKVAGPVADSSILETVELGAAASEEDMIAALLRVGRDKAARPGGTRPVLLANADFLVALLAAHREELGELYHLPLLEDEVLAAVADKAVKEVDYHVDHATQWLLRLGLGTEESARRMQAGLTSMWPYVEELFTDTAVIDRVDQAAPGAAVRPSTLRDTVLENLTAAIGQADLEVPQIPAAADLGHARSGRFSEYRGYLLAEMQSLARRHPGATW
jgi:hypothetical protein